MNLTNRLSISFLGTLTVVLLGFSTAVYFLANRHLRLQEDLRGRTAMQTLVAATEVFPDHVEWEPKLRKITLGEDPAPDQVRWVAVDFAGKIIDRSHNIDHATGSGPHPDKEQWRLFASRVLKGRFEAEQVTSPIDSVAEWTQPTLPEDRTYHGDGLFLAVAVDEGPMHRTLRELAWTMAAVSLVIWIIAVVWGRWLCSTALRPVIRMAASARDIRNKSSDQHLLAVVPTGDEFEELGKAFNELLSDLRESLAKQRRFTGDASHQLRTPLTALLTSVDVTLRHERSPAEYQRVLGIVRKRGDQLREIVESLLFLARTEGRNSAPGLDSLDLCEWCRSWLVNWQEHPRFGDIHFKPEVPLASVCATPGLLGQILDTLLDNALHYSEGGTTVVVRIGVRGDEISLSVEDAGTGISTVDLPRIFEPFYRSEDTKRLGKSGEGLGLAIVQRIASSLHARVGVTTEPGRGSIFTVSFARLRESQRGLS